jgi:ParB-like chromosome segregation protein Spo0J
MKVVDTAVGKIKPYHNNPRHNHEAIEAVVASIKEFGFMQPVVVDTDGVIVVGHTRYQAALRLKMSTVPVLVADKLTPAQVAAYRLADNRVGEIATWDMDKLMDELNSIADEGFDLEGLGFTAEEMGTIEVQAKKDLRFLEDFEVMPKPKPKWILISAEEDQCAAIISAVNAMKLPSMKLEYSGEASSHEYNKGMKEKAK